MWTYRQRSGELFHDGRYVSTGYSGFDPDPKEKGEPGEGVNDPAKDGERGVGPIPSGRYEIGQPFTHPTAGVFVMRLQPLEGTDTHGRSGFLIHGDFVDPAKRGGASHGCIVLSRGIRRTIWESMDHELEVVSGLAT